MPRGSIPSLPASPKPQAKAGWAALLLAAVVAFIAIPCVSWPFAGHDYPIWIDQLILGKWHAVRQGLSPFRWVAHLCGGAPVYGDPNTLFYTFTQAFAFVVSPWWAIQASVAIALVAGYAGWYLFGRRVLGVASHWAHALGFVMIANGFLFAHHAVGHFQMHTVALAGAFLWILFDRNVESRRTFFMRTLVFGLLAGYVLQAAGYYTLLFTALIAAMLVPFDLIWSNAPLERLRLLVPRFAASGSAAALLSASKLVAVYSVMRFFPRIEGFTPIDEGVSTLAYLAKAFWLVPQHGDSLGGVIWETQEKTLYLSHLVLLGLVAGVPLAFQSRAVLRGRWPRTAAIAIVGVLTAVFLVQLTRGHGALVDAFLTWPAISSLRVSTRFGYVVSVLISILAIQNLAAVTAHADPRTGVRLAHAGALVTLVVFGVTSLQAMRGEFRLTENLADRSRQLDDLARADYLHHDVDSVKGGDTDFLRAGTTCGVELLMQDVRLPDVRPGPVTDVRDGAFNLVNPACDAYPAENGCAPGDRIRVDDRENLERFRNGQPVTWRVSAAQRAADIVSLVSLMFCLIWIAAAGRRG